MYVYKEPSCAQQQLRQSMFPLFCSQKLATNFYNCWISRFFMMNQNVIEHMFPYCFWLFPSWMSSGGRLKLTSWWMNIIWHITAISNGVSAVFKLLFHPLRCSFRSVCKRIMLLPSIMDRLQLSCLKSNWIFSDFKYPVASHCTVSCTLSAQKSCSSNTVQPYVLC